MAQRYLHLAHIITVECVLPKLYYGNCTYTIPVHTQVMGIALDVCLAVSYLHRNGVIHGDIKAANVMLTDVPPLEDDRAYCAKLADFGQSVVLHDAGGKARRRQFGVCRP